MSGEENAAKRQKLSTAIENQNEIEAGGPSNQLRQSSPLPDIFKLTADCCDEIFEYLTVIDLHSFGRTCKTFNKVAGTYFKRNYWSQIFRTNEQGIFMEDQRKLISLSGFNRYAKKTYCYLPFLKQLADEFSSVKYFNCSYSEMPNEVIEKILPKIQYFNFTKYSDDPINSKRFYTNLSQLCPNLKMLCLNEDRFCKESSVSYHFGWRHHIFANLTHLKCEPLAPIEELNQFFEKNPSVRSLAVELKCIWAKKDDLLNSTIKLDSLVVSASEVKSFKLLSQTDFFNQLYDRGFYKSLHLRLAGYDQQCSNNLLSIQGLEHLFIYGVKNIYSLSKLTQLKSLYLGLDFDLPNLSSNEWELLSKGLVNLERIHVNVKSLELILPLIQLSKNLKMLMVQSFGNEKILNLSLMNKEREKLSGARKLTIYVDNDVFLATKWATKNGDIDLRLVEMRRSSSYEWDAFLCFY